MKKLLSNSIAKTFWSNTFFVIALTAIAVQLIVPSFSLSKYVLAPVQYNFSLTSSESFGINLKAIGPIIGTTVPGETLTAGTLWPLGATASYQWQRGSSPGGEYVDIPGATSNTFLVTIDDNNSYIKVVARGAGSYSGSVESAYTGPVVTTATPIESMEPIAGAPYVGQELTAGAVEPAGATVTYQWQRADSTSGPYSDIEGAVYSTYTLLENDVDCFIKVVARGAGIYSEKASAITGPIRSNVTPLTAISPISGTAEIGETLTAGTLSPEGATADYQWQNSATAYGNYNDIEGAVFASYTLQEGDVGRHIRVKATGNGAYSGSVLSSPTGPVSTTSTRLDAIGAISGTIQVGETLTAGSLTPEGATATYQWLRADTPEGNYSPISGAINTTYFLTADDCGKYIVVKATGAGIYSGDVFSAPTSEVAARPLLSIGPISGTTRVGETLTAGTVSPLGATVSYQWLRAASAGGSYAVIDGATLETYTITENDANYYLKVSATGTGAYAGTVTSEVSSMVLAEAGGGGVTGLTAIGDITGHTWVYQILTAGTVFPYGATVTYQWYRSDTAGGSYLAVPGATDKTYTTTAADKGCYFKVKAIGSGSYSGTVTSTYAGPITAIPLVSIASIVGTTKIGETLTAGTIGPADATVTYQWQRAGTLNGTYSNIAGATANEYTLAEGDENYFIRVVAKGTNLYSGTLNSPGTGPVTATVIQITAIAPIDGIPQVGSLLTAGATTPVAATVSYQWQKAESSGGPYTDIGGATGSSYTLAAGDLGKYIKLQIKGSGLYETAAPEGISSGPLGPVTARPLEGISNIIGKAGVGQVLTAGTVTPYGAPVTYQWQKYNMGVTPNRYDDIGGATGATYTLTTNDNGSYIRVVATAVSNSGYTGTVYSSNTGPVGSPNAIVEISDIIGITRVGQTLTAGAILPYGSAVSYQWQSSSQEDGTYANINGAVAATYTLTAAEYGKYIRVVASGTGLYFGETISNPTDIITKGIVSAISPIAGQTISGETLTAGVVTPLGATVGYQWQRSDLSGSNFTNIDGAFTSNYVLTDEDEDCLIRVVVTGNGAYEGSASAVTGQAVSAGGTPLTPLTGIGATSGTPRVGEMLTAGSVSPVGATVTYQWQRAGDPAGPYANISGATSATYVLTADDYGKYVRPVVIGSGTYSGTVWPTGTTQVNLRQIITSFAEITGTPAVGETLVAGAVTPAAATVTYQWQISVHKYPDQKPFKDIPGATSSTYTLTTDDNGWHIRVVIKGTGAFVTDPESGLESDYYGRITESPNRLTAISPVTGVTRVAQKLTAGITTPSGASVTYQWLRKKSGAETYHEIPGAIFGSYTTTADDYDSYIKVVATGSGYYSGWVESEPTAIISAALLSGISSPVGTAVPGYTLVAGATAPADATVSYQWQKGDGSGSNYADIEGAIAGSYLVDDADSGSFLRVVVTGYGAYSGSATSDAAGPVSETVPTNITAIGTISGNVRVCQTLTAGAVTPSGATVTYQWQRGGASGGPYENIAGATGVSYLLTPADHGKYIRVRATGSGSYAETVTSAPVGPVNTCPITAIGDYTGYEGVGNTLVAGEITPSDATVIYEWYIYKSGWEGNESKWDYIGSTRSVVVPASFLSAGGDTYSNGCIRVKVIGTGAFSGTQYGDSVIILPGTPVTSLDAIGPIIGTTVPGETLIAGAVTPVGADVGYQWQRSTAYNGTYQNISGATASTYAVKEEDLGYYFKVVATGIGSYSGFVTSRAVGPAVTAAQTLPVTAISDILYTTVPELTLTAGTLTPIGAEVNYQWLVSDTTNPNGNYSYIPGATLNVYTIPLEQALGRYFKVRVTGTGIYSGTITSNYTGPVVTEAIPVTAVSIEGSAKVGEVLSAVSIEPAGATITYQWYTVTSLDEGHIALEIPGAVHSTFTPSDSEYNYYIQVVVTGSGAYTGSATATIAEKVVGIITVADVNMTAPVAGELPQDAAEVEMATANLDYTVTAITWNEDLEEGLFKANTEYTATIELMAKNNKVFTTTPFTPIVTSAESVGTTTAAEDGSKVTFTVAFPQTDSLELSGFWNQVETLPLAGGMENDLPGENEPPPDADDPADEGDEGTEPEEGDDDSDQETPDPAPTTGDDDQPEAGPADEGTEPEDDDGQPEDDPADKGNEGTEAEGDDDSDQETPDPAPATGDDDQPEAGPADEGT